MAFRKRLFAWLLKKGEAINHRIYSAVKRELFQYASGQIVEIGPGTGINFHYLPAGTKWTGVEPNESFHDGLLGAARQRGIDAELVTGDAQEIPLPDNYADTILSTL